MTTYPTLRLGVLNALSALKSSLEADADFLRHPDCPYDMDTVELLEKLFTPKVIEKIVEKKVPIEKAPGRKKTGPKKKTDLTDDDASEVEQETKELLNELRALRKDPNGELAKLDTASKLSIIKTTAQLLEKLVNVRERFANVRHVAHFKQTVIGILDDIVDEDMRDEFLTRLEPYRS